MNILRVLIIEAIWSLFMLEFALVAIVFILFFHIFSFFVTVLILTPVFIKTFIKAVVRNGGRVEERLRSMVFPQQSDRGLRNDNSSSS